MSNYGPSILRIRALIIAAGLLASGVAIAGDPVMAGIDLSGTWILNEELSDNPLTIMQKRMESMRPPGGAPGGMHGGGSPGGGMPGGPPPGGGGGFGGGGHGGPGGGEGEPNAEQMEERMKQLRPAKQLVIVSTDQQVTMIAQGQDTLVVFPDGKKHEHKMPAGVTTTQAEWKDLALEVKIKGQYGREAKRLYRINSDGLLEIVTEFEPPQGGEKITIVTRYDDAEAIK